MLSRASGPLGSTPLMLPFRSVFTAKSVLPSSIVTHRLYGGTRISSSTMQTRRFTSISHNRLATLDLYVKHGNITLDEEIYNLTYSIEEGVQEDTFFPIFRYWTCKNLGHGIAGRPFFREDYDFVTSFLSNKKIHRVELSPSWNPRMLYGIKCIDTLYISSSWKGAHQKPVIPSGTVVQITRSAPIKGIVQQTISYEDAVKKNEQFIVDFFHNRSVDKISWVSPLGVEEIFEKLEE